MPFRKICLYISTLLCFSTFFQSAFSQTVQGPNGEVFSIRVVKDHLSDPWEIVYGPDNYLWITEAKGYTVSRINPATGAKTVLLDLTSQRNFPRYDVGNPYYKPWPQGGLQGLALHPQFLSGKPYVYLSYIYNFSGASTSDNGCAANSGGCFFTTRLVRYEYNASNQTLVNPQVLCDTLPGSSDHNSGRITIAPSSAGGNDYYVYYAIGDMGAGQFDNANRPEYAQKIDKYEGKILRFHAEPDSDPGTYDKWIPNDNPFNTTRQNAVWSLGHRNAQGLAYAAVNNTARLYSSEHGPFSDDEINIIEKGKNYGHPLVIGYNDGNYNGLAAGATSNPNIPGPWHTSLPLISSENQNAASIGTDLRLPLKTLYPSSNTYLTAILNAVKNNDNSSTPSADSYTWQSEGLSGMKVYQSSAIPGWNNSLLITALKGGRLVRLKLNADGTGIAGDTLNYFTSQNRFRTVALSPDGKKIYLAVDSSIITSGPSAGSPKVSLNRGSIMEFSYESGGIAGGLNYRYYEGEWNQLPDFNALSPVKTGTAANVAITARTPGRDDHFAFVWEGYIRIPAAGTYQFETVSDDGSRLYFNTPYSAAAIPTVNNDGTHAPVSATGTVSVPAAGVYPITITYFENNGGETMQVYWTGPGIARQSIPDSAFVTAGTADNTAPSTPANLHVVSKTSSTVSLDWDDATDNTGVVAYDVYAGGVLKYSTVASATTADGLQPGTSYTFAVKARDAAGNVSGFSNAVTETTLAAAGGLSYKYYEGMWSSLPDFNALTPVKTGNSASADISVRTTGHNDNFAFIWQGTINIPAPGNYTFETISDDGSRLYFNVPYTASATPTVNNDGLHAASSATGSVYVAATGSYPITITFFEREGDETMQLYWSGPGFSRQAIPAGAFIQNALPGGLAYKYYEGSWSNLPDFNALTPVKTGNSANTDISVRTAGRNDNFGFVWEGSINIPRPGNYTFETVSDDGSRLYFNSLYAASATPTVNNDGLHAPASATGTVYIPAAGLYPIAITFFEREGGEVMQVYWSGPGMARQLIPDSAFTQNQPPQNLSYKYYEGMWSSLPDFNALTPVKTGNSATTDIGVRPAGRSDNFAFLWEGYIRLPSAGSYTFETVSDDGSKLYFNAPYAASATPTVNNDGLHPAIPASGTVNVPAAGTYPIAITFFEREGDETMQVYWSGPGFTRQPVPAAAFVRPLSASGAVQTSAAGLRMSAAAASKGLPQISKAYPDPFVDKFTIELDNPSSGNNISISISDMQGKQLYSYRPGAVAAGKSTIQVSPGSSHLSEGVYLVTLHVNGIAVKTIRMVKTK